MGLFVIAPHSKRFSLPPSDSTDKFTENSPLNRIEKNKGKAVLIVFWGTQARVFADFLPQLNQLKGRYAQHGLEVVGVNLDEEEPAIDAFLEKHILDWPQIFYSDREKRGWKNRR